MIRDDIVYMDHCAWQELSKRKYDKERKHLAALVEDSYISFALSVVNLEELVFGLNYHKPDSKRVRTARAMLKLGSIHHLLKPKEWLEEDETKAALTGRHPTRRFIPYRHSLCGDLWKVLEDLANASPTRLQFLEDVRQDRRKIRREFRRRAQAAIDDAVQKHGSIKGRADEEVLYIVGSRYEETSAGAIASSEKGKALLRRIGVAQAVRKLPTVRVFHRAGLLLTIQCAQKGENVTESDLDDLWHLVFGAHADVFVTRDETLNDVACRLGEARIRCIGLSEFLLEAEMVKNV